MSISAVACKIAYLQIEIGNFVLISKGLAINWSHLIKNLANPFYVWTWVIGYLTFIPTDIQ